MDLREAEAGVYRRSQGRKINIVLGLYAPIIQAEMIGKDDIAQLAIND